MPRVARLNIAPVRSLGLESREEILLGPDGVAEDRRFYVIDAGDRLVDQLTAGEDGPGRGLDRPRRHGPRLTFPDGIVVEEVVRLGEPVETDVHGRTAVGHLVDGPWAAPLGAHIGRPVRIVRCDRIGGTRKAHPATLVSDGSLDALGAVARRRRRRRAAVPDAHRARRRQRPRGGHLGRRPDRPRRDGPADQRARCRAAR